MTRTLIVLLAAAFLCASFAGCLGNVGFGSSAPRAAVTVTETDHEHTFIFDGRDSKGKELSFAWELGDGTTATGARVEHTYEHGDGVYTAKLVIEDKAGTPDVWQDEITVGTGQNNPPMAYFKVDKRNYALNETVRVDASLSMDDDGDPLRYRWDFNHFMDFDEYEAFRADKKAAVEDAEDGSGTKSKDSGNGGDGEPQGTTGSLANILREHEANNLIGYKDPGHGHDDDDDRIQHSLFSQTHETKDPVYVLTEGFPEATTFFIRLQVWDIKGGHEAILSEEIWPVEVWKSPPENTVKGNTTGNFTLGADEEVVALYDELVADDELLAFETEYTFEIHWPIAASTRATNWASTGAINLSWEAESDAGMDSVLEMNVTAPNGKVITSRETDWGRVVELDGKNDYYDAKSWEDEKPWRVKIYARQGINIDWELEYWAQLDTNKFADHEE